MAVFMRHLLPGSTDKFSFSKVECVGGQLTKTESFTLPSLFERHRIVGYCDGLFCLEIDNGGIIVWNSCNKVFESVPSPTDMISPISGCPFPVSYCAKPCTVHPRCKRYTSTVVCGFGRTINTDEFKVVANVITYFDDSIGEYDGICKQVFVYTLGMNCRGWTEIECPQDSFMALTGVVDDHSTWVGGCCYWMAQASVDDPDSAMHRSITKLDLATLEFSIIKVPCFDEFYMTFILMELNGSLGLIVHSSYKYDIRDVHTWLFEEDKCVWSELSTSPVCFPSYPKLEFEIVLGYLNTFLVFIGRLDHTHLLVYDCDGKKFCKLDLMDDLNGCMLFPFSNSSKKFHWPTPSMVN